MLTCREVVGRIASDRFAEAGWLERVSVRLHLALCRHCRRYAKQLDAIGTMAQELLGGRDRRHDADDDLEPKILERITKEHRTN